jgi:hypothetical protein
MRDQSAERQGLTRVLADASARRGVDKTNVLAIYAIGLTKLRKITLVMVLTLALETAISGWFLTPHDTREHPFLGYKSRWWIIVVTCPKPSDKPAVRLHKLL